MTIEWQESEFVENEPGQKQQREKFEDGNELLGEETNVLQIEFTLRLNLNKKTL